MDSVNPSVGLVAKAVAALASGGYAARKKLGAVALGGVGGGVAALAVIKVVQMLTETAPTSSPIPAASEDLDVYGQAASTLVAGSNLDGTVQEILDMGGGTWDRETVVRAIRAAFNNPERADEYLYSGIPESAEAPPTSGSIPSGQAVNVPSQHQAAQPAPASPTGPNVNPSGANTVEFLRNSPQYQALRAMVQANPQILQPMLQELGNQNPQLGRMIQDHQADFLHLINEPTAEDDEGSHGQDFQIPRNEFETDPSAWFRNHRR